MAVPMVEAITARRSCTWCSAGESAKAVASVETMAFLPLPCGMGQHMNGEQILWGNSRLGPRVPDIGPSPPQRRIKFRLNFGKDSRDGSLPGHLALHASSSPLNLWLWQSVIDAHRGRPAQMRTVALNACPRRPGRAFACDMRFA